MPKLIRVEIACATPRKQVVLSIEVEQDCNLEQAIAQSAIMQHFPELDLAKLTVGVFGTVYSRAHVVQAGDRVEIYRPLSRDPKQMRKQRAEAKPLKTVKNR